MGTWVIVSRKRLHLTLGHQTSLRSGERAGGLIQIHQLSDEVNGRRHASAKYSDSYFCQLPVQASEAPTPIQKFDLAPRLDQKKFGFSYFFAGYIQPKLRDKFLFLRKFLYGWPAPGSALLEKRID